MKLQAFDSNYFRSESPFEDDDTQNYSVFQRVYRYFKTIANSHQVTAWKSKGLSVSSIKPPGASNNSLAPITSKIDKK